ncbi:hypothetical protein D3C71_1397310 [compost metagenome]
MLGDALDDTEHGANVLDLCTEALDAGAGRTRRVGQLFDPLHALADHLLAGFDLAIGRLRRQCRLLGVTRHVVYGGRHLVHRGGDLIGLFLLAADFKIGLLGHG